MSLKPEQEQLLYLGDVVKLNCGSPEMVVTEVQRNMETKIWTATVIWTQESGYGKMTLPHVCFVVTRSGADSREP